MLVKGFSQPRFLAVAAGGLLILLGVVWPCADGLTQTGPNPVRPDLVADGRRLLTTLLLGEGLLILAAAVLVGRRHTGPIDQVPLYERRCLGRGAESGASPWLLMALLGGALALRLIGLDGCLWYDEVVTLTEFVRLPFAELVQNYADQNQHPLYSIAARASILLFGESAWSLRLPAALFGVGSLWALYGFARRVAPWPEPLVATTLLALSYHHVWFSQNARGYTGLLFWTLVGSALFLDLLHKPGSWKGAAYAMAMALGLYTHLTAGFLLVGHGLIYLGLLARKWLVHGRLSRRDLWPVAAMALCGLITLNLYALVLPQVLGSFRGQVGGLRVQAWTDPLWGVVQVLRGLQLGFAGTVGALLALAIGVAGLASYLRRDAVVGALLLLPCVLGVTVMLLLHRHMYPRFFFTLFGFAALVAVRGALVLGQLTAFPTWRGSERRVRWGGLACAVAILLVSAVALPRCYQMPKQDYTGALAFVQSIRHPDDPLVVVGMAAIPVERYYGPDVAVAKSAEQLEAIRARRPDRPTWLLYTFRDHMQSYHPDLLEVIDTEFVSSREFPGTVAGGAIIVCRSEPTGDSQPAHAVSTLGQPRRE